MKVSPKIMDILELHVPARHLSAQLLEATKAES